MDPHYYKVDLQWISERKGEIYSTELDKHIAVATPPQFNKGVAGIWSPEHLLTAAVNSCYMTTFLAIAENSKLEFISFDCHAEGKLEQIEGHFLMTEISLEPTLVLKNIEDKVRAERILQKSEIACLVSNSIKSKVHLKTHIE